MDIAHLDSRPGGHVADLQQDLQFAARRRCDGMGNGTIADRLGTEVSLFAADALVAGRTARRAGHIHRDRIACSGLQFKPRLGIELDVPIVAGLCDSGRGARSVAGQFRLGTRVCFQIKRMFLNAALGRFRIGEVSQLDFLHLTALDRANAQVAERDVVSRSRVGLAELQLDCQRAVGRDRGKRVFHALRAAGRQAEPVIDRAVVLFLVSVKGNFKFCLVPGRADVKADLVGLTGCRRHAGRGAKLGLPSFAAALGSLGDLQRGRRGTFVKRHHIAVCAPAVDRVGAAVGKAERKVFERRGDRAVKHLAGLDRGVQREERGQDAGIVILDLLHMEIADPDGGALRRVAERELHDELVAFAAAGDHGLAGRRLAGGSALAVKGAVALLFLAVVQQHLKGQILIAGHVRRDAIVDAGFGDHAGLDIKTGLPHAVVPGRGEIFDVDLVACAREDRGIALVVLFPDEGFLFKINGHGERVLIVDLVRVLLDLDLGKVDREGRQHAELQIQIARAGGGDQDAGDAVFALVDVKLLEVSELDLAGHVRAEAIGHAVVAPRDGGIVALELDVPRLAVGLVGGKTIHAVDDLPAASDGIALELGAEHRVVLHRCRRYLSGSGKRQRERAGGRRFMVGREQLHSPRSRRRGRFLDRAPHRLRGLGSRLAAAGEQECKQEHHRDQDLRMFHIENLLASIRLFCAFSRSADAQNKIMCKM